MFDLRMKPRDKGLGPAHPTSTADSRAGAAPSTFSCKAAGGRGCHSLSRVELLQLSGSTSCFFSPTEFCCCSFITGLHRGGGWAEALPKGELGKQERGGVCLVPCLPARLWTLWAPTQSKLGMLGAGRLVEEARRLPVQKEEGVICSHSQSESNVPMLGAGLRDGLVRLQPPLFSN